MNKEELIEITDEQIILNFIVEDKKYVAYTESTDPQIGDDIYFARAEILDNGMQALIDIPPQDWDKVIAEFERITNEFADDDMDDDIDDYIMEGDEE